MRTKVLALAAVCLAACMASLAETPEPKPDFSGTWEFSPERSSLEMRSPDASTFIIEHEDPRWRLERTHVFGDRSDTLTLELTTDGEPTTFTLHGWQVESRLHWEDQGLVFESTMSREGRVTTVTVRYRLEDDGRTFVAEEHMESEERTHDNYWVFDRCPAQTAVTSRGS